MAFLLYGDLGLYWQVLALVDIKFWANWVDIFVIGRLRIIMSAPFALPHVGAISSASDF